MALNIYYDKDADLGRLDGKTVAIIGYGSQGHAHAQNLHNSGVKVVVGLRKDSDSWGKAEGAGLAVATVSEAAAQADIIMMTLPDEKAADIYESEIKDQLEAGNYVAVAHGFNFHFEAIKAPADVNVIMIAPKGPGHTVRANYEEGRGVPALVAVHQDPSGDSLQIAQRHRIERDSEAFRTISQGWGESLKRAVDQLPDYEFPSGPHESTSRGCRWGGG